jgi:hypothetical protein
MALTRMHCSFSVEQYGSEKVKKSGFFRLFREADKKTKSEAQ